MTWLPWVLSFAAAGELQVVFTAPHSPAPVALTLADPGSGPLPGLVFPGEDGTQYLVHLDLTLQPALRAADAVDAQDQVLLEARIERLTPTRRGGQRVEHVSTPRVLTTVGVPARVMHGARVPVPGSDPVEFTEVAWTLELLYTEAAGR